MPVVTLVGNCTMIHTLANVHVG